MAWQTKRRLRRKLAAVQYERDLAVSAKDAAIEEQRDAKQLAQMVAERDERIAWLEKRHGQQNELIDWFNNQCAHLESRIDRFGSAWRSARRRAAREHGDVRLWMRMTTYAEEARDEAKSVAWRYRLAWMSAKERASELRRHHDLVADEFDDHTPAVEINHELAAHLPLETNACWGDP